MNTKRKKTLKRYFYIVSTLFSLTAGYSANNIFATANGYVNFVQQPIKGKVLDELGMPLPGATVMIKGKTNNVVTDAEGNFEIVAHLLHIFILTPT